MEKLDARIRNHDREIEKMCNFHHQGFVDAIKELLKVRADAEKLMVMWSLEGRSSSHGKPYNALERDLEHAICWIKYYNFNKEQL